MGTRIFDFLADSLLFDKTYLADAYSAIPERELRQELDRYREFCIDHRDELAAEVLKTDRFRLFPGVERSTDLTLLKQTSLYVEQYLLDDPLFAAASPVLEQ